MKRLLLVVSLALLVLVGALELAVRGSGRTTLLGRHDVFAAERRGWFGGAWLETDAGAQRRGATAWRSGPHGRTIVVVGGSFTAGAGLEDDELWTARLEARLSAAGAGYERVVGFAFPRGKPAEIERLLPALGRDDVLVIEVDARDLGGDPSPFEIHAPVRALQQVERRAIASLQWLELLSLRRERRNLEAWIAELVARDGFTGRASARSNLRLEALTRAVSARPPQLDAEQIALLRAWLEEFHGLSRSEARAEKLAAFQQLFEKLRIEGRPTLVLATGPTPPLIVLERAVRDAAFPIAHAAPFELDPDLRVEIPPQRPAAIVHAQAADSVWTLLSDRALVPPPAAAPAAVRDATAAIEQQVMTRGGYDDACISLARQQIGSDVTFQGGAPPLHALAGIGEGGRVDPEIPAELLLKRPTLPEELIVRARVPGGVAPRLALRHAIGGASADPKAVGPGTPDLYEWRFEAPAQRAPIDFTALELTCLPPEDGSAGGPIELRDVRYTLAPSEPEDSDAPNGR